MLRRLALILAAAGGLLGLGAALMPTAANADITHVVSPVPTGLVRVCVGVQAADTGVCLHL